MNYINLSAKSVGSSTFVHFADTLSAIGEALGDVKSFDINSYQSTTSDPERAADQFACSYLSHNLLRKVVRIHGTVTDPEKRRAETLFGFLTRENVNRRINQVRTWGYSRCTGTHTSDLIGTQVLLRAREYVQTILGATPDINSIISNGSFGNGASATLVRTKSQDFNKFLEGCSVTTSLKRFMIDIISTSPAWSELAYGDPVFHYDQNGNFKINSRLLKSVAGGVLDYVPKDFSIDRIIIKEPELNGFVQKGIGTEIRSLLAKPRPSCGLPGVLLNTSGSFNSALAQEGSLTGMWATVDGERASDSLTLALYELMFPKSWYDLLCMARSPYVLIEGKYHRLEMMSGMGNGFTFEAESVLFYAIGLAAAEYSKIPFAEQAVSIHGDDLVIPSDVIDYVKAAYAAAGVVVNKNKTFSEGPFRESCGGHFYLGYSVKPFYVKAQDGTTRGDWFWLYNSLLLWLNERSDSFRKSGQGVRLIKILKHIAAYASNGSENQWRVPVDSSRRAGLFSNPPKLRGGNWKGRCVVSKPVKEKTVDDGAYLRWLNKPAVRPSVYDLLFSKREAEIKYEYDTEVHEVERFIRRVVWNGFRECGLPTPLWLVPTQKRLKS